MSLRQKNSPSTKAIGPSPSKDSNNPFAAKNYNTMKRLAAFSDKRKRVKRPKKRGPFLDSSCASDTGSNTSSGNESEDSSSQGSNDTHIQAKITQSIPRKGPSSVPTPSSLRTGRPTIQGVRALLANRQTTQQNAVSKGPSFLASTIKATPTTSVANHPRRMQPQIGSRQHASLEATKSQHEAWPKEKGPPSGIRSKSGSEAQSMIRTNSTAFKATCSRPSKAIPTTMLRSTHSARNPHLPSRATVSGSKYEVLRPTSKHDNASNSPMALAPNVVSRLTKPDGVTSGRVKSSTQPPGSTGRVGGLLGDIRQNDQPCDSTSRQNIEPSMGLEKSTARATGLYKQPYSSTSSSHVSAECKSQTERKAGQGPRHAVVTDRRLDVGDTGAGSQTSARSQTTNARRSVNPSERSQLQTLNATSPAKKRKFELVAIEPLEHSTLSTERPPMTSRPQTFVAHSQSPASVKDKSTRGSFAISGTYSQSYKSYTSLGTASMTAKPTSTLAAPSSSETSQRSSASATASRRTARAPGAMESHNLLERPKSVLPYEVPKAVDGSVSATKSDMPPSILSSVPASTRGSREKGLRSSIITTTTHPEDKQPTSKVDINSLRPEIRSDVPAQLKISSASTEQASNTSATHRSVTTPAATGYKSTSGTKHESITSGPPLQRDSAQNKVLEEKNERLVQKDGDGETLVDSGSLPPKLQIPEKASTLAKEDTPQPSARSAPSDPRLFDPRLPNPRSSVVPDPTDPPKEAIIPEAPAEPKLVLGSNSSTELRSTMKQAAQDERLAATATTPAILSVRRDMLSPEVTSVIDLSASAALPKNAEPFFEYSIHQKIWSGAGDATPDASSELSSSCTNVDEANAQAKRIYDHLHEQYQQYMSVHFSESSSKRDENGCDQLVGTFAPVDHPGKKSFLQVWVRRALVSTYAGQTPKDVKYTSFVSKTVYVLRLFKLMCVPTESERDETVADYVRVHHPHSRTECYTTLGGANRAAKNLQVELSHKSNPSHMDTVWQSKDLAELNQKVMDLEAAGDGEAKYWKSNFNASGLGSDRYELLVEMVTLCGPRNL